MKNGYTGGQYSLYRAIFGGYLFIHFGSLVASGTRAVFPSRFGSKSLGDPARSLIPKCSYLVGFPRLCPVASPDSRRVRVCSLSVCGIAPLQS